VDLDEHVIAAMADRLVAVPGVVAVSLGGSRARGDHTPESDVDLGLYYRPPLDTRALGALARELCGPAAAVTEPGEWGPWVDGGAWLTLAGTPVDWIYRDLDRVDRTWADARAGRYAFHTQAGHPLGVPDFAYAGEVALGLVLADPTGELTRLRRDARQYPPELAAALAAGLWEASFTLDVARKGAARGDASYVAGCLFRAVGLCAHALHGAAGRWLVNEKGAVAAAGRLPVAPRAFTARAQGLLASVGTSPAELAATIEAAQAVVTETVTACTPARRPR
jgi:predicted nucleotidyltransferase